MPESIELVYATLGLRPYVLIEAVLDDDPDTAGFKLKVVAGGGIESPGDIREVLNIAIANFPDVPVEKTDSE